MRFNEIAAPPKASDKHISIAKNNDLKMTLGLARTFAFMETVKTDCIPYLKEINYEIKEYQLLRGVIGQPKNYIAKTVRLENRKPKDTSQELHDKINEYFEEKFGSPFRNAIHVTGDFSQAFEYAHGGYKSGEVYVIFPVGEFKYLWSQEVADMLDVIFEHGLQGSSAFWDDGEFEIFAENVLSDYKTTDLTMAIKLGNEIMMRSTEYYGLKDTDTVITHAHWPAFAEILLP